MKISIRLLGRFCSHRNPLIAEDQQTSRFPKRLARWQISKYVAVLLELIANALRGNPRLINLKDDAAGSFNQLVDHLSQLWHVPTYSAASAVLRLYRVNSYVLLLQLSQNPFE